MRQSSRSRKGASYDDVGMSKLTTLEVALRARIRAGDAVHVTTQSRAATRAIQRVFQGQALGLTLIMGRVGGGHGADLLASGLVSRVIAGSYGAVSNQYTGRLAQVQRLYESGAVTFQHWTFYTLMQRLMAAAQGLPFVLTHSLAGSCMARDNGADFMQIADPFGSGSTVNLLRALHPDVAIVHVDAADEEGNAILLPPFEEGTWGAKASRRGVIVTAEHVVTTDYIRRNSHLVQLPGRYVSAVVHAPYGAHPGPFGSGILPDLRRYEEDEAFNSAYFAAVRDPQALRGWVDEWILGFPSHSAYLEKLGESRLSGLKYVESSPVNASERMTTAPAMTNAGAEKCSDNEIIMTLAMRHILRHQANKGYDVFLVGAGLSEVPATAAHTVLTSQGARISLVMGHGYFGFTPTPGRSDPDATTSVMTTDASTIYGTILGGRRGSTLAILGAGQVDQFGNLNSTIINGNLLTGSGGSNDSASTCDVLHVTRLTRKKLVDRVEYITCPGSAVSAVITERGIFEKSDASRLTLTSYIDMESLGREGVCDKFSAGCGWPLEIAADLRLEDAPSANELALIRQLMPSRYE